MSVRARVHMTRNHPRFRTQIKNRFRGGEAPGGYRDVNVSVMYRGLVCEVQARSRARARACAGGSLTAGLPARAQLHISAFFELKEGAHSCYGICRELGLAGEVADPQKSEANSDVDGQLTVPQGVVAHVTALRFSAGGCAVIVSSCYIFYALFDSLPELWGRSSGFKVIASISAAVPYSLLAYSLARDMILMLSPKQLCATITLGVAVLMALGAAVGFLGLFSGITIVYLLHFAAAFASVKLSQGTVRKHSRVARICALSASAQ